jgi:hypothetical protein
MKVTNQRGQVVALFRGKSAQIQGTVIPETADARRPAMTAFPLEPIEKASIDELRALQLKRLKATLASTPTPTRRSTRPSSTRRACTRTI